MSIIKSVMYECDWCKARERPSKVYPDDDYERPAGWQCDSGSGSGDHVCPVCWEARSWAIGFARHERLNGRNPARVEGLLAPPTHGTSNAERVK